jgi:Fe-S oxidoreductase
MTIEDVILTTENCRYCLMCRHIVPVEQVTYRETHSPHGWALLVASQRRGLTEWNGDTVDALYSAPDGGNSRAHCVTDQPLPEALAAVRAEIAGQGLAPDIVYTIDKTLKKWGTPYKSTEPHPLTGEGDTALFVGDEAAYLWPTVLNAVDKLLDAVGIQPVLLAKGRNNGLLASSLGLPDTARGLIRASLDELSGSGAARLIVLSPGDRFVFGQMMDERLGLAWPEGVELVELVSLLAAKLTAGEVAFNKVEDTRPWAYVDPTHAVRVPARHDDPRCLLSAVMPTEGRELYWRRERAHPVGSTYLQFVQPEIARKLTHARLADARQAGAELIICEDPGTLIQLNLHAEEYGLEVKGLYELLAAHLA